MTRAVTRWSFDRPFSAQTSARRSRRHICGRRWFRWTSTTSSRPLLTDSSKVMGRISLVWGCSRPFGTRRPASPKRRQLEAGLAVLGLGRDQGGLTGQFAGRPARLSGCSPGRAAVPGVFPGTAPSGPAPACADHARSGASCGSAGLPARRPRCAASCVGPAWLLRLAGRSPARLCQGLHESFRSSCRPRIRNSRSASMIGRLPD